MSFMIRSTSPIGWVFLVLYKLIKERSLLPFILAFFAVAIPSLILFTALDSYYYGAYTFVPYNFMHKNLVENVSAFFGISPPTEYLTKSIPYALNIILIFVILGIINNLNEFRCKH